MKRQILNFIFLFVAGMGGGIFATQIAWPYFVERPLFEEYRLDQRPVYLSETKEVVIRENQALSEAIERTEKAAVALRAKTASGQIIDSSGVILSSDGLIVALSEMAPQGSSLEIFINGRQVSSYQITKRDSKENLVLIKAQEDNLPTLAFGDLNRVKIGERVFLSAYLFESKNSNDIFQYANEGIIKSFNKNMGLITTNILDQKLVSGSSLLNIEGHLLGMNMVNNSGNVSAISLDRIRAFAGI